MFVFCKRLMKISLLALGLLLLGLPGVSFAQQAAAVAPAKSHFDAVSIATRFLSLLPEELLAQAVFPFDSEERFDWHFVPRTRKGLSMKVMNEQQRNAAMALLRMGLSEQGYHTAQEIMDLENVLRELENRPSDDTRRDPINYSFSIFGTPSEQQPWGWRIEGHHLSLHFSFISRKQISFMPGFMGTNPAIVPSGPQKGRQILKRESEVAYELLKSFTPDQLQQVVFAAESPYEIITANNRKISLESPAGLSYALMNASQKKKMLELLNVYIGRYHKTLANNRVAQLEKMGLDKIYFAWAGSQDRSTGHYYRIQGPTLLIEFDNTQNDANHVHTVVRDLNNDFGEDFLSEHYKQNAHQK
jgi:hypothetical protein